MSSHDSHPGFRVERLPDGRQGVLDLLAFARRVPVIHGLLEVDVTEARRRLAQHPEATVTAFVTASVAQAIGRHPEMNVRRAGRRVIRFDTVDVVVTAEERSARRGMPKPYVLRAVDDMSFREVADQLRVIRSTARTVPATRRRTLLERLPSPLRRIGARLATRSPAAAARFGPPIGISSLGMFGAGLAWGIPISPMTLMVTVGSIGVRPAIVDQELREREVLALTLSFDHSVIDGAPAARFAATLRDLLEQGSVIGRGARAVSGGA